MAIGPLGSTIYANQNMHLQAGKQTGLQNRLDMQNAMASAATNEKGKEVREIRPTEATYKIDPEKEHEKQKNDEETGAKEEEITKDTKHKHLKETPKEEEPPTSLLDISV